MHSLRTALRLGSALRYLYVYPLAQLSVAEVRRSEPRCSIGLLCYRLVLLSSDVGRGARRGGPLRRQTRVAARAADGDGLLVRAREAARWAAAAQAKGPRRAGWAAWRSHGVGRREGRGEGGQGECAIWMRCRLWSWCRPRVVFRTAQIGWTVVKYMRDVPE